MDDDQGGWRNSTSIEFDGSFDTAASTLERQRSFDSNAVSPPPDRTTTTVYIERQQKKKSQGTTPGLELSFLVFLLQPLCLCLSQLYAAPLWPPGIKRSAKIFNRSCQTGARKTSVPSTHTKTNNLTYYYYHPKRGEKRNENIETKKGGKKEILFGRLITFQTTSTRSLLERELRLYPLQPYICTAYRRVGVACWLGFADWFSLLIFFLLFIPFHRIFFLAQLASSFFPYCCCCQSHEKTCIAPSPLVGCNCYSYNVDETGGWRGKKESAEYRRNI